MEIRNQLDRQLKSLDKLFKKYGIVLIISIYLVKVYGSLLAYEYGFITVNEWEDIHFVGVQLILLMFMILIKDNVSKLISSIGIGLFTSRLVNQFIYGGFEFWHEMPLVLILIATSYYIQLKNGNH